MTQLILPEIQATGAWKLKSPYQNLLTEGIWYTCIAVRKLEDYINRGIDVFEEYYNTPYMIPKERYEQDLAGGACIIIVRNASGDVKAFPNTYLESFPAGGGVAYQSLAAVVELGAVPVDMDLTTLQNSINALVKDTLGVVKETKLVNLAPKQLLDRESAKRIEAARQGVKKVESSPLAKVKTLEEELKAVRAKLAIAEAYIIQTEQKKK